MEIHKMVNVPCGDVVERLFTYILTYYCIKDNKLIA